MNNASSDWVWQRHEDRLSAGIPDISFVSPNSAGWLEMKATILDRKIKIRTKQINWLCDRARFSHFNGFLLCRVLPGPESHVSLWLGAKIAAEDRDNLHTKALKRSTWHNILSVTKESDSLPDILAWLDGRE